MKNNYPFVKEITITVCVFLCSFNIRSQTITTVAGVGSQGFSGDGSIATSAHLDTPNTVEVGTGGTFYITDWYNHRIRKVDGNGTITTIAGNGTAAFSGDGGLATSAQLNYPTGLALDSAGNIYITDRFNYRIRKITISTGLISTIAGTGTIGNSGDGGAATSATLNEPFQVSIIKGNLYFSDYANHSVRKINLNTGIITTVAGTGISGYSGDGGLATAATMNHPCGITVVSNTTIESTDDIYIAESGGNVVRKIAGNTGIITTATGTGVAGFSGDGGPATAAKIDNPVDVICDIYNNVYVSEHGNNRIRKIDGSTGIITTVAGTGTAGYSGDGGLATSANLNSPCGMSMDATGNIYFADRLNSIIRKFHAVNITAGMNDNVKTQYIILPNPSAGLFSVISNGATLNIEIMNILGEKVYSSQTSNNNTEIDLSGEKKGVYFIRLSTKDNKTVATEKIILAD